MPAFTSIMAGVGLLGSAVGTYFGQKKSKDEAKKAESQASQQYAASQARMEGETKKREMELSRARARAMMRQYRSGNLLGEGMGVPGSAQQSSALIGM